jgi:hypothetical protein
MGSTGTDSVVDFDAERFRVTEIPTAEDDWGRNRARFYCVREEGLNKLMQNGVTTAAALRIAMEAVRHKLVRQEPFCVSEAACQRMGITRRSRRTALGQLAPLVPWFTVRQGHRGGQAATVEPTTAGVKLLRYSPPANGRK